MAEKKRRTAREVVCSKCGQPAVPCFAGTHNGLAVLDRYYCQADRLQVIVLVDEVVVELADGVPPEGARRRRSTGGIRTRLSRLRATPRRQTLT